MTLPQPGPGRPQHPSYSEPGLQISLLELALWVVGFVLIGFAWSLVGGVV
jgi:hypothetical protein